MKRISMEKDSNRNFKVLAWIAIAVPAFFLLAAGDLALRSRSALHRAEREEAWRDDPAAKAAYFEGRDSMETAADKAAAAAPPSPESAARAADLRKAGKEFRISESSAKMAYIWYKTAAGDFYFPMNPWAARARVKLPAALAAWRAELAAKGVKAEEWMLE
ncbi:MAG: hypothetical protein Q8O90_08625 [Elusimicrobiota bacterium]|nr:hypothetical protein [Elusimicrobiota bacterium]